MTHSPTHVPPESPDGHRRPLSGWAAVALVALTSGAVLTLEVLGGRLIAPYAGVSLETQTGILGTVLIGIAVGAWGGGAAADRVDPARILGPLLVLGGGLACAAIPALRALGPLVNGHAAILAAAGLLPAATVLSAVPPVVVKLQVRDLGAVGTVVGRLSAFGTVGAIAATFLTGFVLVRWAAVHTLVLSVGVVVGSSGVFLSAFRPGSRQRADPGAGALSGAFVLVPLGLTWVIDDPCGQQTPYHCVTFVVDDERPSARYLVLDDLIHAYVDLDDPTHLELWYVRRLADAVEVAAPAGELDVVHLGAGGFTLPRHLGATRPGSRQVVMEIDGGLVGVVESELGIGPGGGVEVQIGDGRILLARRPTASADVVVGDAFANRSIPWHLATEEFFVEVARVLRPDGVYVANVIDGGGQRLLRAEVATLSLVFPYVSVILSPQVVAGARGNAVLIASRRPLDTDALDGARAADPFGAGARVVDIAEYTEAAGVLSDAFAPVDQLIAR